MIPDVINLATSSSLHYSIAAPNSLNKERADLDLTGVADPAQAIMDAIAQLDSERVSDDVAIVIEFMGGEIELANETNIDLSAYSNLVIRGNGVSFVGQVKTSENSYIYDLRASYNEPGDRALHAQDNCVLINCKGYGDEIGCDGIYTRENCTLINCEGEGGQYGTGIKPSGNCVLLSCTGKGGEDGNGFFADEGCAIIGCDGTDGGIIVVVSAYPNTQELLEAFNKGTITIYS